MTPESTRRLGTAVLLLGIAVLLVNLAGMTGLIAKVATSRELSMVAFVLVIAGGSLLRRGRKPPV